MIKLKEGQKVLDVEGNVYLVEKGDLVESTKLQERKLDVDGNSFLSYDKKYVLSFYEDSADVVEIKSNMVVNSFHMFKSLSDEDLEKLGLI